MLWLDSSSCYNEKGRIYSISPEIGLFSRSVAKNVVSFCHGSSQGYSAFALDWRTAIRVAVLKHRSHNKADGH